MKVYLKVRETIHHGNYRNVREQTVEATWNGIVELLEASPYNGSHGRSAYEKNQYVLELAAKLLVNGHAELGWANYDVVERLEK